MEILFDGGRVIKNYSEDRVQIVFDTKPRPDVISNLKHNGFVGHPVFSAWQRQLTDNAFYAVTRVVPVVIEQLRRLQMKVLVTFSGGKDSLASLLWVRNKLTKEAVGVLRYRLGASVDLPIYRRDTSVIRFEPCYDQIKKV